MKLNIADRIASMPTSIFSTMSKLAVEYKAVNLGQGFPDFDGPEWLIEASYFAMKDGKNQYAPSHGILSLRESISDYHDKFYNLKWNPETEITVTAGATEAIFSTINAFVNPGDEVIVFEPFYDSYQADVILAGGICRYITLNKPDFKFDFDQFLSLINNNTKLIILNSPHNPTGKVFTKNELQFIADIAIENDILVLSDEVYEFLTYDGKPHIPIASLAGMKKRTITISSAGKTFSMTGWKIGYAIADKKLTEAIRKVHQWVTFAVNTPSQHAVAFGFNKLEEYLPDFKANYSRKRNLMINELKNSGFKCHTPYGSYFIMVDYPANKFDSDIDAATRLVQEFGIATIPPSVFYSKSDEGKSMLRLCFAKTDDVLLNGSQILKGIK